MNWCCNSAKNRFESRLQYGEFLVAGFVAIMGRLVFLGGFNMCHRTDYEAVTKACRQAETCIRSAGISNFKLSEHKVVHYCCHCGANLAAHYGENGGLLRDDAFVGEIWVI